ncbi:hypothetical protein F941_02415 [Acinetobacter bouvetii DSM 14964 = CIP 107468]|uniref:Uncharacterized protein n=1 Tax=Acinetobacter bouvetii DSM 14964 = CIP 107468 TaxID=1120925 RepID=N9DMM7_9GAMM|nr:hypothetical protein F941_02415 [Acinetobacter bouvetii DSM 14964 = CIP 107468]
MAPELLQSIIQCALGLILILIIVMLTHLKWRKKPTQPEVYSPKKQRGIGLLYGIKFISYPILGLFKIIFSIFK